MLSLRLILIFCLSGYLNGKAQDIFDSARKGNIDQAEKLVKINPDTLNKVNESGFNPLVIAAYRGQSEMVAYLLTKKVSIDYVSPEGTALMAACYKNELEIARMILEHGANVNLQSGDGTTALIFSVLNRNAEMVKLLLKHGANKDLQDAAGNTALSQAKKKELTEIVMLLEH